MDREIITAFTQATMGCFLSLCRQKVIPRQARSREEMNLGKGVHAIIGMSGQITGAVVLSMPDDTARVVVGALVGEAITEGHADLIDGVQEMTNILIGAAKKNLETAGISFRFGLPKALYGELVPTDEGPPFRHLGIIFTCPAGPFLLHLTWKNG